MKAVSVFGGALAVASIGLGEDTNDASNLTERGKITNLALGVSNGRPEAVNIGVYRGGAFSWVAQGQTKVELGAGLGPNGQQFALGGNVPAIALFNVNGYRLGQYMPSSRDRITAGTIGTYYLDADQVGTGKPQYILLTTVHDDGICLNSVTVTGSGASYTWLGDVGSICDMEWYPSVSPFGEENYQPRCAWIDADHSDGIKFIGISMHMPDFTGSTGIVLEYQEEWGNLCNSRGRFMRWGEFVVDPGYNTIPGIFTPPLEYYNDGSDKNFSALFSQGVVNSSWPSVELDYVGEYIINGRPVGVSAGSPFYNGPKRAKRDAANRTISHLGWSGHVIISDYNAHHAAEVCESETSLGPSFVSTRDGSYCDMDTKTLYPVCSADKTSSCFDLDNKRLVKHPRHIARDVEARDVLKQYLRSEQWTPKKERDAVWL